MKKLSKTKALIFTLLAVSLTLFILEAVSYLVVDRFSNVKGNPYHPYLGWEAPENTTINVKSHCPQKELAVSGRLKTDDAGRSITPLHFEKPDLRIAVTGGSTMFGMGSSSNETTVPSYLEKLTYERTGIKTEVYNLAVGGYQSFQEMLALYRFLKDHRVDLVISVSGKNDAEYALDEPDIRSSSLTNTVYEKAAFIKRLEDGEFSLSDAWDFMNTFLQSHSSTVMLIGKVIKFVRLRAMDSSAVYAEEQDERGSLFDNIPERAAITSLHYSMMSALSRENGAKYLMFLQPTAFTKKHLTEEERACSASRVVGYKRISNRLLGEYENRFFCELARRDKDYTFFDISELFREERSTRYVDMCHYNDEGARILAEAIYSTIEPLIKKTT